MRSFDLTIASSVPAMAARLLRTFDAEHAGLVLGVSDSRTIIRWADGSRLVRGSRANLRLRMAFQAVIELESELDPVQIQKWFTTVNEGFGYRSAIQLLGDDALDESGAAVVKAAAEYVGTNVPADAG